MVTILPKENDWSGAFESIGRGVSQGIEQTSQRSQQRADEMALQKAVMDLGDNPPADKILKAILGTKTHNNKAKQDFFGNALQVENFKEMQRHAKETEEGIKKKSEATTEIANLKKSQEEAKELAAKTKDKNDSLTLLDSAKIPHEEKKVLREKIDNGEASFAAIKEVLKPNKEDIKNKEEEKAHNLTQNAFNEIAALVPDVGRSGIVTSKFGGDTAKAFAKFTTLTGALEALLVEQVNRGALSNVRFSYIKNDLLPTPSDTQAEITGKLEGLATILNLDPSVLTGEKGKKEAQPAQGESKRPPLTSFERK